jgi:hypothetical protein
VQWLTRPPRQVSLDVTLDCSPEVLEHERTSEAVTRIGMFFLTIFCQSGMTIEYYGFFRMHLNFTDMRTGNIDVTVE